MAKEPSRRDAVELAKHVCSVFLGLGMFGKSGLVYYRDLNIRIRFGGVLYDSYNKEPPK